MSEDRYPKRYLKTRLFDTTFSIAAILCLTSAVIIGVFAESPDQELIIGLGMVASAIGSLLEYRQKTFYDKDHVEGSLLSDSLQAKYLNTVAKLRHKLVGANVLIAVVGIWVSGYGAVWHAP